MNALRRHILLLFMLCSIFHGMAQSQPSASRKSFTQDTLVISSIIQRCDAAINLSQSDRAKELAQEAIETAAAWLSKPADAMTASQKKEMIRWKAKALDRYVLGSMDKIQLSAFNESVSLFQSIGDRPGEALAYEHLAERHESFGDYLESIRYIQKSISIYSALGDVVKQAKNENKLGVYYRSFGAPGKALEYHLRAMPVIKESGDSSEYAFCYILIGAVHRTTQDWTKALHYFQQARDHYERTSDSIGIAISYNDLGTAWNGIGNPDSAFYWHRKAADLRRRIGSVDGYAHSLRYMAKIYAQKGQYEQAIAHFEEAADYYARVPIYGVLALVYSDISQVLLKEGKKEEAISAINEGINLFRGREAQFHLAEVYIIKGNIYRSINEPEKAVDAYESGVKVALDVGNYLIAQQAYQFLFPIYEQLGDYRNAYISHEGLRHAKDSTRVTEEKSRVMELMMRNELEQLGIIDRARDDATRQLRENEIHARNQQKYMYLTGGAFGLILALAIAGRLRYTARARKRLKLLRDQLQDATFQAEQSEKFKERFLANMSHEIRTPMNAIMGMTKILQRNTHLPEQQQYLDAIVTNSDALLRIINDILDLSKMHAGRLELEKIEFDLHKLTEQIYSSFQSSAAGKGIQLTCEYAPDIPRIFLGDITRINQLISNLVENAVKFTEHGSVTLMVAEVHREQSTSMIQIAVSDTGVGIAPERLPHIFDEFSRAYTETSQKHSGSGLGLTICRQLTELHGGKISVENNPGSGARFVVELPLETSAVVPAVSQSDSEEILNHLTILLVDDNEFNIMVAQDELEDALSNVTVDVATNGREAIEKAASRQYDIILMDVQMPEMSGYEAALHIRHPRNAGLNQSTPILAMTANVMDNETPQYLNAGMNGFIPKPFTRAKLIEALIHALSTTRQ